MSGVQGVADFRKLATLMRSELHLNPDTLSDKEFVERARDVLWLLEFKQERLLNELEARAIKLINAVYGENN